MNDSNRHHHRIFDVGSSDSVNDGSSIKNIRRISYSCQHNDAREPLSKEVNPRTVVQRQKKLTTIPKFHFQKVSLVTDVRNCQKLPFATARGH